MPRSSHGRPCTRSTRTAPTAGRSRSRDDHVPPARRSWWSSTTDRGMRRGSIRTSSSRSLLDRCHLYARGTLRREVTVDLELNSDDAALQASARRFADEVLQPLELRCEEHDGLTPDSAATAKHAVLDHGFAAINHSIDDGGRGLDTFQVMLVEEQWGRVTNALWDVPWRPSIPLAAGTEEQKERFLRPACRGERRDAYAITEAGAGSDVTMVAATARRDGDAWGLDGEKWHGRSGDVADFFLWHATVDGDPAKATFFSSTRTRRACGSYGRRSTPTRSCSNIRSSRSTASGSPMTACSVSSARCSS